MEASKLTDLEKQQISAWAAAGAQLPELQKKIQTELDHNITYMDTRFLILDLGIELTTETVEVPDELPTEVRVPTGCVEANVDSIERPGALKSGSVT